MQEFINKTFFALLIFTLVFGVMLYDVFGNFGFSYIDEICAVLILSLFSYKVAQTKTWDFDRKFLITISIFLFYLIYSLAIHSNTKGAIITDFIIQIKPYLSFFCIFAIKPQLSDNQKLIIKQTIFLCSIYTLIVGLARLISDDIITYTFYHDSRLATATSILALLYLYCSDYTKTDKIIFIAILAIGILSGKAKHFGYFALCSLIVLYVNKTFRMELNFRNTMFLLVALALTIFVAKDKIYLYFIKGGFGEGRSEQDLYARIALYFFSLKVFLDYIPFGSGFASYATFASGASYSHIYKDYGMSGLYGLTESSPKFIADTYYPALAQFGVAGVLLFFWFWISLAVQAIKSFKTSHQESIIALLIIIFFLIECTSDSTITHNRGMFMMMILGMTFSDIKENNKITDGKDIVSQ